MLQVILAEGTLQFRKWLHENEAFVRNRVPKCFASCLLRLAWQPPKIVVVVDAAGNVTVADHLTKEDEQVIMLEDDQASDWSDDPEPEPEHERHEELPTTPNDGSGAGSRAAAAEAGVSAAEFADDEDFRHEKNNAIRPPAAALKNGTEGYGSGVFTQHRGRQAVQEAAFRSIISGLTEHSDEMARRYTITMGKLRNTQRILDVVKRQLDACQSYTEELEEETREQTEDMEAAEVTLRKLEMENEALKKGQIGEPIVQPQPQSPTAFDAQPLLDEILNLRKRVAELEMELGGKWRLLATSTAGPLEQEPHTPSKFAGLSRLDSSVEFGKKLARHRSRRVEAMTAARLKKAQLTELLKEAESQHEVFERTLQGEREVQQRVIENQVEAKRLRRRLKLESASPSPFLDTAAELSKAAIPAVALPQPDDAPVSPSRSEVTEHSSAFDSDTAADMFQQSLSTTQPLQAADGRLLLIRRRHPKTRDPQVRIPWGHSTWLPATGLTKQ